MITLYAKKIPFKNTKVLNPSKWIRITQDEKGPTHGDKMSPAWRSPRYKKSIDQLPRDYGVGRYTPGPITADRDVKITKVVAAKRHGVIEWKYNDKWYELLCVHAVKWSKGVVKKGKPIFYIDAKARHLHASGAINGKAVSMDKMFGKVKTPVVDPCKKEKARIKELEQDVKRHLGTIEGLKLDLDRAMEVVKKLEAAKNENEVLKGQLKQKTEESEGFRKERNAALDDLETEKDNAKSWEAEAKKLKGDVELMRIHLERAEKKRKLTSYKATDLVNALVVKLLKRVRHANFRKIPRDEGGA